MSNVYLYTLNFLHELGSSNLEYYEETLDILVHNVRKHHQSGYLFDYDGKTYHTQYRWALIKAERENLTKYEELKEVRNKIEQLELSAKTILNEITQENIVY